MGQLVIHSDPQIQGGVPVFFGTRVPVKNLFDYLESGDSLDLLLKDQMHTGQADFLLLHLQRLML